MQSLALNRRQRSKFHRDGVSHQPAPSIDKQKEDAIDIFKRRSRVINNNSHTVVNLSSHQLTEHETSLLSRGLNFCPVPGPINETKLSEELDNFARSLRIKEHFGSKEVEGGDEVSSYSDSEDTCDYRFVKKSKWVPKPNKNVTLESFIDNVKSDILRTAKVNTDTFDNLTPGERTVLQNLRSNEDIIIKPADKGSSVVVMDKSAYIREVECQLSDDRFFYKLDKDPTKQFSDEIQNKLNNMYDNGDIDEKTLKYLIPDSPKPGRFYLLPKIHKANKPGRPIVSASGHPTEKISGFVDFHLRQHVEAFPSIIKDTTYCLQKWQL
jgi:hypothetical protein